MVSSVAVAHPIQNPGTGHYYERIDALGITWDAARAAAETRTWLGASGHLATIGSQEENDFITDQLLRTASGTPREGWEYWVGGFQPQGSPEPGGNWQWVTGEPMVYTAWQSGEPNNWAGNENCLEMLAREDPAWPDAGRWNDRAADYTGDIEGYIVEYVPEPATLSLLFLGGCALLRPRR
jgi:hypothetical protein